MNRARDGIGEALSRRFRPYPAYKDSGIEWLGEIPAHWEVMRLGFSATFVVPMRDKPKDLSGVVPWIRIEDFDGRYLRESKSGQGVSASTVQDMNLKVFPVGTVLCSCSCNMGATAIVGKPLVSNQTFIGIVPGGNLASEYVYYLMQVAKQHLTALATGAIQQYLSRDDFSSLRMPHCSRAEQILIATFLDRETAKIDGLVARKERLIELLHEKRTALISRVVTRGLDPNVPMKDSSSEWLGNTPVHWKLKKLKHLTPGITVGIVVTPSKYYVDQGVPCLRSLNVSRGAIDTANLVFISENANELHRKSKIFAGDVVVVRTGQAGIAAIVPKALDGANCIDLLIVRRSEQVLSQFVYYFLNSRPALSQATELSVGAIQSHYNTSTLAQLVIPQVPIDEQSDIVKHLDGATAEIDRLVTKVQSAINLLMEFRTALISAAVTGKIDVREAIRR